MSKEHAIDEAMLTLHDIGTIRDAQIAKVLKGLLERQLSLLRRVAAVEDECEALRKRLDGKAERI